MIPGVTTQVPGKRFRAQQVISIRSPSAVSIARPKSYFKTIATAVSETFAISRLYARPRLVAFAIGESVSSLQKRTKALGVSIGQSISYMRRFPAAISVGSTQTVTAAEFPRMPGLQLWLDAADASTVTIGTGVSAWADKSGAGLCTSITQGTGAFQPSYNAAALNGLHTVGFNGSNSILLNTSSTLLRNVAGYTGFMVGKFSSSGHMLCVDSDATGSFRFGFNPGRLNSGKMTLVARRLDADTPAVLEEPSAFGTGYGIFTGCVNFATTTGTLYEGTSSVATSSSFLTSGNSSNDFGAIGIGANPSPGTYCACSVGEFILYSGALASGQITQIQNYLKSKWNL